MRGMSQQKLAEQLGLKRNNIASYEAGIVEPKAINFLKLAIFFEASPSELFGKDLTANFVAPQQNQPSGETALLNILSRFSHHTSEMQKVLEGFREFQKLSAPASPFSGIETDAIPQYAGASGELDNILNIMDQLLASNWKLIQVMTKKQDE